MDTDSTKSQERLHVEHLMETKLPKSPIYDYLLSNVEITQATSGKVIARMELGPMHMNSGGSLHGAVSATIVDWMGGMAIASTDLREGTGVSVDIHISYHSGAKLGSEIEIEGIADKVGGNLAFTRVAVYRVEGGERGTVVAMGTHTKFVKTSAPSKSSVSRSSDNSGWGLNGANGGSW